MPPLCAWPQPSSWQVATLTLPFPMGSEAQDLLWNFPCAPFAPEWKGWQEAALTGLYLSTPCAAMAALTPALLCLGALGFLCGE